MFRTNALNRLNMILGNPNAGSPAYSFAINFDDNGGGTVNTVPWRGAVSPTFTRATTATTVLSTGLIGSVASGATRSYYDPTSLAYLGYLAEGARTNLCLQSEVLGTTWTATSATIGTNAIASPDGTTTADLITQTGAGGRVTQDIVFAAGGTATFSVWVKKSLSVDVVTFILRDDTGAVNYGSNYTFSTNTFSGTDANTTNKSQVFPNGWIRITSTNGAAITAGNTVRVFVYGGNAGGTTDSVYAWGAQLEAGSFASSYIPTTVASVTRNADVLTYPVTGWLNAAAGTLFAQFQLFGLFGDQVPVEIGDGTLNERYGIYRHAAAGTLRGYVVDGGVLVMDDTVAGVLATNTTYKAAIAVLLNNGIAARDGSLSAGDVTVTLPTVTTLSVGDTGSGSASQFGTISSIRYIPQRVANAQLQTMTS